MRESINKIKKLKVAIDLINRYIDYYAVSVMMKISSIYYLFFIGSNCVDWKQVYSRIAKSLSSDVQFVLLNAVLWYRSYQIRLKHKTHT